MTTTEKDREALLKEKIAKISPPDAEAMEKAAARQVTLAKVPGSLGKLEDISIKIAGITGRHMGNDVSRQCIAIFCADNGVVSEGVASAPQSVTMSQTINFTRRITGMSSMAKYFGINVLTVDMGVADDIPEELYTEFMLGDLDDPAQHPVGLSAEEEARYDPDIKGLYIPRKIVDRRLGRGTENLARGPAMSREQMIEAMLTGFEAAEVMKLAGIRLCGIGEMGIGNTTTSSCILGALTGENAQDIVGRGGGLNDEGLAAKVRIVKEATERCSGMDPFEIVKNVGGFDIAAMAGCFLGAAAERIPVVIDGFISVVAACVAKEIEPMVTDYMFCSHKSKEVGYNIAMERLGLFPMFDLEMRLGEGSGCPIAFKIIEAACASMDIMKTLDEGGINAEYLEEIKKGDFF